MRHTTYALSIAVLLSMTDAHAQELTYEWAGAMGSGGEDVGRGIAVDGAGNVCTIGIYENTFDADPSAEAHPLGSAGGKDIFISKLDAQGDFLWAHRIGSTLDEYGNAIAVDDSGNVYTTGYFAGTVDFDPSDSIHLLTSVDGFYDMFVLKLDAEGAFMWAHRFGDTSPDKGNSINVDAFGSVYIAGELLETCDMDPGPNETLLQPGIFVQKLHRNGTFKWARQLGNWGDAAHCISTDQHGNVYTTGQFSTTGDFDPGADEHLLTSAGGSDVFVSKLDSTGAFVWAGSTGGTDLDEGYGIAVDPQGNMYLTGFFKGTSDFDPSEEAFILTANVYWDGFTMKLYADGSFAWAFAFGGSTFGTSDVGFAITVDNDGTVYTTGNFLGNTDFDPGPTTSFLNSGSNSNIFVQSLTTDGALNWVGQIGSGSFNYNTGKAIALAPEGYLLVTGSFVSSQVDFDPGAGAHPLSAVAGYDVFVLALGTSLTTAIAPERKGAEGMTLFPNPAQDQFTIRMDADLKSPTLTLTNAMGQAVFQQALRMGDNAVLLPDLAAGVYGCTVFSNHGPLACGKVVVE